MLTLAPSADRALYHPANFHRRRPAGKTGQLVIFAQKREDRISPRAEPVSSTSTHLVAPGTEIKYPSIDVASNFIMRPF